MKKDEKVNEYADLVKKVSRLANLSDNDDKTGELATAFKETIAIIDQLAEVEMDETVAATTRIGEAKNRWREDEVIMERVFTQTEALANATRTHEGYFVVDRLIDDES